VKLHALAAVVAATLPLLAWADGTPAPADRLAAVPYRSAFDGPSRGVEEGSVAWKAANAEVARFPRGHIDLLKWEQAQAAHGAGLAPAPAAPSDPPGASPAAAAPPAAAPGHRY
jgi:hypothetical protein